MKPVPQRSELEIEALVEAFESASIAPAAFDHHAHVTIALWYLMRLPYDVAVARMRERTQHFAAATRHPQLYNETITLFWMKLLRHVLEEADRSAPATEIVASVLARWGSQAFVFKHYTKERVLSETAKREWVEPDLRPLGFG